MKIFISWSGERSLSLARALREWLPLVLHYAKPWLSDTDVHAGKRWSSEIADQLEGTNFGIICLTKDNIQEPWILFEAGALSKTVTKASVCPYLLDLQFQDLHGPLAQFQAKKAEKLATLDLLKSINAAATTPLTSEHLEELFTALWPKLSRIIKAVPVTAPSAAPARKAGEILEDLVFGVRRLDYRIELMGTLLSTRLSQLLRRTDQAAREDSPREEPSKAVLPTPMPDLSELYAAKTLQIGVAFRPEDRDPHLEAQRLARLLVTEINLYNEIEVERGRIEGGIYKRLRDDIERAKFIYEDRVGSEILEAKDYFYEELVAILADGDESKLGYLS